jgi:hypothetical protein
VNYIFHKLSVNTKHVQFQLRMSMWWIFVENGYVLSSFFLYFLRSSHMQPCGWNCERAKGQSAKKEVCFAHRILVFHFFLLFFFAHGSTWCQLECDRYNQNVKFFIFVKKFTRFIVLKFWVKTLVNKKNFSSFIIINLELRFEPCMFNLIWKWGAKDPKKREDHLIFISFGIRKFTIKSTQEKENIDV